MITPVSFEVSSLNMAGDITTVLFVWTIIAINVLVSSVQAVDEPMTQVSNCGFTSISPTYQFGLGYSIFDFHGEEETLTFEYLNNTYYFRLCGTSMFQPCRFASICKQTTSPELEYSRITPLRASDIIREDNGISIDYEMNAIVNAICIDSTSPSVNVLDTSNGTTLLLDYYTQYACEGFPCECLYCCIIIYYSL